MEGDVRISGQLNTEDAVAWIGVQSPSAPHRIEAVQAGVFHIGRGVSCHLRLGDESIPDVLAAVVADRRQARICCLAEFPQLILNGEPVQDSPLTDGDILEAGDYKLVFRRMQTVALAVKPEDNTGVATADMSAAELVDAWDEAMDLVELHEHTPTRGLHALMSGLSAVKPEREEHPDAIPMDDVRAILHSLEQGQHRLRLQQEEILSQLEALNRQYDRLKEASGPGSDSVVPIRTAMPGSRHRASA